MAPDRVQLAVSGLGLLLVAVACGWTVWAVRTSGLRRILGRPSPPPALVLRGPYRFVRHPCCSGVLLFLLGTWLWCPGWIAAGGFVAGLGACLAWVAFHDRRGVARFGEAYRRYREAVPALVPGRSKRWREASR